MDDKLQLRIQRYGWDAAASVYEAQWQKHLAPVQQALLKMSALQSGMNVIETAAGTGLITFPAVSEIGLEGSMLATDLSGEMVKTGNLIAVELGLSNVIFKRMNAEALECKDNSFDRALCCLGLMFMPNPSMALKEMKRVLRPNGMASIAVWGERRNCGWAEVFPIVDSQVKSEVCPLFFGLGSIGALSSEMKAAGFSSIQEHRIKSVLSFDSSESVLSTLIDGGAIAMAAKRFDDSTRKVVDKELLKSVEVFRIGEKYEIPSEFVIVSGTS